MIRLLFWLIMAVGLVAAINYYLLIKAFEGDSAPPTEEHSREVHDVNT